MNHSICPTAIPARTEGQEPLPGGQLAFTKPYTDQEKWMLTTYVAQIPHCTRVTI